MDGATASVQKMISGKQIGACADGTKGAAHGIQAAQLVAEFGVQRQALNINAGAQKCNVGIMQIANRFFDRDFAAIARRDGIPVN
ncbi:hypothetical protein LAB1_48330 [Roseibium sp. LAB1]